MAFKKWSADKNETHDWTKDKVLEGLYTQKRIITTSNGDSNLYTVEKKDHKIVDVWGNSMLDSFFKNMKSGTTIKIIYMGKVQSKKGGRSYHSYEFEYDDSTAVEEISDTAEQIFNP